MIAISINDLSLSIGTTSILEKVLAKAESGAGLLDTYAYAEGLSREQRV